MKFLLRLVCIILLVFVLPTLVSAGLWATRDHPRGWRDADWSATGMLAKAEDSSPAAIYVFSAMTGGFKGAIASHAWIVTKAKNGDYHRYDKVGWGEPIRMNNYPADGLWYSNRPRLVLKMEGAAAERLIPKIEAAIKAYPYRQRGGYRIYPGPNSNTFVAHVLRQVPELGVVLPPDAVGRDYLGDGTFYALDADGRDLHLSLAGLAGVSVGVRSGLEVNFLGLVAGVDLARPGLKIPGFGTIGF